MEWLPPPSADVLYVATPPLSVPVPRVVVPSMNVTVPVELEGNTVAVKVTDAPNVEGFNEEASVIAVPALFTVCVNADEVLPL